jgi:hypothetical protein
MMALFGSDCTWKRQLESSWRNGEVAVFLGPVFEVNMIEYVCCLGTQDIPDFLMGHMGHERSILGDL